MQWDTGDNDGDIVWIGERWTAMDTNAAERLRRRREMARIRKARERVRYPNRDKRSNHHKNLDGEKEQRKVLKSEKLFVVWDGEGPQDTGYSLLGNSEGMELCHPTLKTIDCLEFLIAAEQQYPDAIHIGFGFNYDVSNILADLSWRHLSALKKFNKTTWRDFEIQHIPHKWFRVKQGKVTITIYDVWSFFMSGLVVALEKWKIGPWDNQNAPSQTAPVLSGDSLSVPPKHIVSQMTERQLVETFKKLRSVFMWADIESVRIYMRLELKYTKILMEQLREAFLAAGYLPDSWHGPGALARMALKRHRVYDSMAVTPVDVQIASRYGYIGGRFSPHLVGHIQGPVYSADINSAYPYAATFLPNLAKGVWRRTRLYCPGKFGIYRVQYEARSDPFRIYPLPYRSRDNSVCWPFKVTSWFWSPETALVKDDPDATILEGWVFEEDDPSDRPFAFLHEYYRRRKILKQQDNPAEYTFKLIINAIYGQLAQRAGWDQKNNTAPNSHQLEWAGFITSFCRAMVYRAAVSCGEGKCISIDTDGVMSVVPIPLPPQSVGNELGQWEVEEYTDGVFWQSGMYALKDGDQWIKAKTRGIPKGTYEPDDMITSLEAKDHTLRVTRHKFVGYGLALSQKHLLNKWVDEDVEYRLGGNGKVCHSEVLCDRTCSNGIHRLMNLPMLHWQENQSTAHFLPWLAAAEEQRQRKEVFQDLTLFDMNDNDEWVINYET